MAQAKLLATRIVEGKNDYVDVVTRRPDLKHYIDDYLREWGREDLIVEVDIA